MAVPVRADVGRQDRPGHVGETAGEERRGGFDDVVLGLEPGDVMRFRFAADLAEADEGVHLVFVAVHGFGHPGNSRNVGIGRDVEQIVMAEQAPQQAIQDCKPLGIAVQDRRLRQLDEFGRDVEGALCGGSGSGGSADRFEQFGFAAAHRPGHVGRASHGSARVHARLSPAFEIGFAVEGYEVHLIH